MLVYMVGDLSYNARDSDGSLREDVFLVDCTRYLGVVVMLPPRMSCWHCSMHFACTHHLLNNDASTSCSNPGRWSLSCCYTIGSKVLEHLGTREAEPWHLPE